MYTKENEAVGTIIKLLGKSARLAELCKWTQRHSASSVRMERTEKRADRRHFVMQVRRNLKYHTKTPSK